jgi:hypothetical protein
VLFAPEISQKKRPRADFTRDADVESRLAVSANKKALKSNSRIEDFVVRNYATSL